MRGFLDATSIRIVEVNPILISSLEYSHLRLLFYPLPAASVLYATRGLIALNLPLATDLEPVCLNQLLQFRPFESQGAAHLHKRNPFLPHPAVERGFGNS